MITGFMVNNGDQCLTVAYADTNQKATSDLFQVMAAFEAECRQPTHNLHSFLTIQSDFPVYTGWSHRI